MPDSTPAAAHRLAPPEMVVQRMPDDDAGHGAGFGDVFSTIDMCRAHYAAVGLGADDAERLIR